MPKYDYKCPECGKIEEWEHSIQAEVTFDCGDCYVTTHKTFTATPAIFKGQGWAAKDKR